jgi:transposase
MIEVYGTTFACVGEIKRGMLMRRLAGFHVAVDVRPIEDNGVRVWLNDGGAITLGSCLEATGGWSEDLALALHEADHVVCFVNPMRVKAFAKSEMLRTKTDRVDAALIARFCRLHAPEP